MKLGAAYPIPDSRYVGNNCLADAGAHHPIRELHKLERKKIMKRTHKIHLLLLVGLVFSLLAACAPQETVLGEEEAEAVLAFSEQKTDNLLAAMNVGDYAAFSRDFDQQMLDAMTETQFEALKTERDATLGAYVSRQVNRVVQAGDFYAVFYDAKFEKEESVAMRVVFRIAEPNEISGLWFDK